MTINNLWCQDFISLKDDSINNPKTLQLCISPLHDISILICVNVAANTCKQGFFFCWSRCKMHLLSWDSVSSLSIESVWSLWMDHHHVPEKISHSHPHERLAASNQRVFCNVRSLLWTSHRLSHLPPVTVRCRLLSIFFVVSCVSVQIQFHRQISDHQWSLIRSSLVLVWMRRRSNGTIRFDLGKNIHRYRSVCLLKHCYRADFQYFDSRPKDV